jgi:hypothetical protein
MNIPTLVILKGKTTLIDESSQTKFIANKHYRCIEADGGMIVYGVWFCMDSFNNMFVNLHDVITEQWSNNGLLPNMKPLSKSKFAEVLDLHQYGKGKKKLFIGFVGNKMDGLFAFQPLSSGETKAKFLAYAYKMYQDVLNGDMTDVDEELIQRGNSGVPITFGDIYFRKEYNPNNEKREIYC